MQTRSIDISDQTIRQFEADGVVHLKGVIDPGAIERLATGIDGLMDRLDTSATGYDLTAAADDIFESDGRPINQHATQHDHDAIARAACGKGIRRLSDAIEDRNAERRGRFRIDTTTWKRCRAVRALALDSGLPSVAAQLLQCERINFLDDQVFVKDAMTRDRTAFHQDYTYFHVRGWKGCVMWICVDPASAASGVPCYVRGSHRWGAEFRPNVFIAQLGFPGSSGKDLTMIEDRPDKVDVATFQVTPGDVIVHHFRTVHGAGGNSTMHPRRALSLRYCGDDIRFRTRPGAPLQPYHQHALADGDRLDSCQFPVVWPRPYPDFELTPILESRGLTGIPEPSLSGRDIGGAATARSVTQ